MAGPVPPPLDLVTREHLGCLQRLFQYRTGSGAPMMEEVQGVPARCGGWGLPRAQEMGWWGCNPECTAA